MRVFLKSFFLTKAKIISKNEKGARIQRERERESERRELDLVGIRLITTQKKYKKKL